MADFKISEDYIVDKRGFAQSYPVGSVIIIMSSTIPDGWLLCDGRPVSRSDYTELWNALGTTSSPYGQGDGSTTFNLPPLVVNATHNPTGRYAVSRQSSEATYPANFQHTHSFYTDSTANYSSPSYAAVHNHSVINAVTSAQTANHNHAGLGQTGVNNVTSNLASSRFSSANNAVQYSNDYVHDHGAAFTVNGFNALSTYGISHTHSVQVHASSANHGHTHTIAHANNTTVDGVSRQGISFSSTEIPLSKEAYFIIKY